MAPFFILVQVLFLNNIWFTKDHINPLLYLILVISLPQNTEKWFLIIYAFSLGILLDLFEGNIGMNSSALVFISFLKPYINKIIIPKNYIDEKDKISLKSLGIKTFSTYAFTIIFIHNCFWFLLEHFSFASILEIWLLLIGIISNSIVTFIIILIFQLFTFKTKDTK
tara:strand:- start:110 stop:610 length:501 start_codon:yes stop_codon:yes gene_type:complete